MIGVKDGTLKERQKQKKPSKGRKRRSESEQLHGRSDPNLTLVIGRKPQPTHVFPQTPDQPERRIFSAHEPLRPHLTCLSKADRPREGLAYNRRA